MTCRETTPRQWQARKQADCIQAARMLGKQESHLNLIVAHLGAGASVTAIQNGRSVDTTMGLTPLEG